jgi:hypothetical protein
MLSLNLLLNYEDITVQEGEPPAMSLFCGIRTLRPRVSTGEGSRHLPSVGGLFEEPRMQF